MVRSSIDTDHASIKELVNRFGLVLDDLTAAQPPDSEDTFYFNGRYYPRV